ncbi:MAG: rod shape-determining protein RodA [Flavobacterium sp. MedPE-SWcel]|uniref:rod shape-determining protein RodA n=1 Tax=uncultured Flavobacterium sp. TaxID=165435 RepID=UPI00090FAE9C|nr:rod shape-determining protein RodA [uncultured Flavobacterium sp.]OIQ21804.1 MAG: rod shape-determining protein RodA [Flavobacterium sp. MedPE-SWcel]
MRSQSVSNSIDWVTVLLYLILVTLGWMTIYSASLPEETTSFLDLNQIYGKQLLFIILCVPLIFMILVLDSKIYEKYAFIFYGSSIILLAGLFVFGKTIKGQTNWYSFGGFGLQPSEFAKIATAILLAKYLSYSQIELKKIKHQFLAFGIILLPVLLILMQPDAGSAMIFIALILAIYRDGLPDWYLWTGFIAIALFIAARLTKWQFVIAAVGLIMLLVFFLSDRKKRSAIVHILIFLTISGYTYSTNFVYENVLKSHQRERIDVLFNEEVNQQAEGYNLNQSLIAIGSGGWTGRGYLEGTQTKGNFVPEQHTDYIFTTVGEEWGFAGSATVIALFVILFMRILFLAERQKSVFSRTYGYCVAAILFLHFFANIAMLIKLFPTIGVPLPFFSYGGSSLFAFTILLFIFIKLDANRVNEWY